MLGDFDYNLSFQTTVTGVVSSPIYDGCVYVGQQETQSKNYKVKVQIQNVDLKNQIISGYMHIANFNADKSSLTTYFEGEFISEIHPFLTNKWGADRTIDNDHWKKFSHLKDCDNLLFPNFDYSYIKNSDYIFMRWKEKSVVLNKDQDINRIAEAIFAGFYYISLKKSECTIEGYYYFHSSEKNQHLTLRMHPSTSSVYTFC